MNRSKRRLWRISPAMRNGSMQTKACAAFVYRGQAQQMIDRLLAEPGH
jgi:hypothetical protein